jgi:hypothetical protein
MPLVTSIGVPCNFQSSGIVIEYFQGVAFVTTSAGDPMLFRTNIRNGMRQGQTSPDTTQFGRFFSVSAISSADMISVQFVCRRRDALKAQPLCRFPRAAFKEEPSCLRCVGSRVLPT